MYHTSVESLHATCASEQTESDPHRRARVANHARFGSWLDKIPFKLKWDAFIAADNGGCKCAIAESSYLSYDERQGLYDTQMLGVIAPADLFVPIQCRLPAGLEAQYPNFTDKCSRFYQNCAIQAGFTTDARILNLDNASIRTVMAQHQAAICTGTFYPQIGEWDVSRVTDMSDLFRRWREFNQPIGKWETAQVECMTNMFFGAHVFDAPIQTWDTRLVTDMSSMFEHAHAFNQPIGNWDTRCVTDMTSMFADARTFNQPIVFATDVVRSMSYMFAGANAFNRAVQFNTASVTNMIGMFSDTRTFDQTLGFDTASVERMASMFENSAAFNNGGATLEFDTARVREMSYMFRHAVAFQQDAILSDMSRVTHVQHMLVNCGQLTRVVTARVNRLAVGFAEVSGRIDIYPKIST
jgi:surface protein